MHTHIHTHHTDTHHTHMYPYYTYTHTHEYMHAQYPTNTADTQGYKTHPQTHRLSHIDALNILHSNIQHATQIHHTKHKLTQPIDIVYHTTEHHTTPIIMLH